MQSSTESSTEILVRRSRRSLLVFFFLILSFGAVLLAVLTAPHGPVSQFFSRAPWAFPMFIIGFVILQRALMGNAKWDPKSPEVRAIVNDELRRTSFDRAARIAFFVALFLQVPLALGIESLAPHYALLTMAVATITLSVATLVGLLLYFDRE
jgi:MFS family permease